MFADDLETAEKRLGRAVLGFCKKFSSPPPLPPCTRFDTVSVAARKKAVG